jgi:4-hydroxy-tetrahydrodipicolinate reductase
VRVLLFGAGGKVGTVLGPRLQEEGHEVTPVARGVVPDFTGHDAAIDFTRPDAVRANVEAALRAGVPCVVGTTGLGDGDLADLDALARERGAACFLAPNFAIGAVLMMRFAAEAARHLARAEIVELHDEAKVDAPSGTAKATAKAMGRDVRIHSVRLPGLVAHQEVLLGGLGQLLTIRHDTTSREAFVPGVLLALEKLDSLESGLTVGLESLLDQLRT